MAVETLSDGTKIISITICDCGFTAGCGKCKPYIASNSLKKLVEGGKVMVEPVYGRCAKCGRYLTIGHKCPISSPETFFPKGVWIFEQDYKYLLKETSCLKTENDRLQAENAALKGEREKLRVVLNKCQPYLEEALQEEMDIIEVFDAETGEELPISTEVQDLNKEIISLLTVPADSVSVRREDLD